MKSEIRETIFEDGDENVSVSVEANYRDNQLWIVATNHQNGIRYGTMLTVPDLQELIRRFDREADRTAISEVVP